MIEDGSETTKLSGTPQGGVISPLPSNIYLHVLDEMLEDRYAHLGELVRYADDLLIVCRTRADCEEAERKVQGIMRRLGADSSRGKDEASGSDLGDGKDSISSAAILASA